MTTPAFAPNVVASTPTVLATTIFGKGFPTNTRALVSAMRPNSGPGLYYLGTAISSNPDSFFVIPCYGDSTRQWIHASIYEQSALGFISPEIDLTQVQIIQLIPPINYKYTFTQTWQLIVTAKDGTVTTGPTMQGGSNSAINDVQTGGVQAITATALNGQFNMTPTPTTGNNLDMSANGMRLQITSGAVLGTATVFKARLRFLIAFNRY